MPLHTKYRPKTLATVIGNSSTVNSLQSVLAREGDDLNHSFLFVGPHGCGKTTMARIAAKDLGCHPTAIHEIDSADFRGIDSIRTLRKNMALTPMAGKRAAWLLDECHKLTTDAQNALLKALEEPPEHVFFFLCTTDPQKLIGTVKSRCALFSVDTLSEAMTIKLLNRVLKRERKTIPQAVKEQIAQDSLGHARDALVMLDTIIDADPKQMMSIVKRTAEQQNQAIELCRLLMQMAPWPKVAEVINGLDPDNLERTRQAVIGYCKSILLKGSNERAFLILDVFIDHPFYDTKVAGLVHACYEIINGE